MRIKVITIGDELLLGQVADTNSGFIARSIDPCGWELHSVGIIHDNREDIKFQVTEALENNDVVVTTGGLGPTRDDITKAVMAEIFGGDMVLNRDVLLNIEQIFLKRSIPMNELTRNQALVPSTCKVITNRYGTAPVMWFEKNGKILVSLPGVPYEMEHCWEEEVLPRLIAKFIGKLYIQHKTFIVAGISESALAILLNEFEENLPEGLHLAYLPKAPYIRLRLDGRGENKDRLESLMDEYTHKLLNIAGSHILADEDLSPSQLVQKALMVKGYTVATAESCTGGTIASAITSNPGSSSVFKGGVVAYSNDVKISVLGVDKEVLKQKGAVSEEVVSMMCEGIVRITDANCSIATSGIAGPSGGTEEKPVGTVWVAIKTPGGLFTKKYKFLGNRDRIVARAVDTALLKLYAILVGKEIHM